MADTNVVYLKDYKPREAAVPANEYLHRAVTIEELICVETELRVFTEEVRSRRRPLPTGIIERGRIACPINTLSLRTGLSASRLSIILEDAAERGIVCLDYRSTDWDLQLSISLDGEIGLV